MKKPLLLFFMITMLIACNQVENVTQASTSPEAEAGVTNHERFGQAFTEESVITATALQSLAQGKDSVDAVVTAEIVESCQSKGCWMDVKLSDNSTMKVTFRDYGFFMPVKDLKGRTVVFTGTAKREVVSVEDQRHFAEDAGKSETEIAAIISPREELRFIADGVILK